MRATAIMTPTMAAETPVIRLTMPAIPAPTAMMSERKSGATRSRFPAGIVIWTSHTASLSPREVI
jgi:hypothetical protein